MSLDTNRPPDKTIRNDAMLQLKKSGLDILELKDLGLLNEVVNAMIDFKFPKRKNYKFRKKKC